MCNRLLVCMYGVYQFYCACRYFVIIALFSNVIEIFVNIIT